MDDRLFHSINGFNVRYGGMDDAFGAIAIYSPFVFVALLLGIWFWPRDLAGREDRQWSCMVAVGATLLSLGINQLIIQVWQRPRPFATHAALVLLPRSPDPSFPSDHATFGFAVAVAIVLAQRRIGLLALALATALAFARVYVGEHYLGDVIAGALIGTVSAILVFRMRPLVLPYLGPILRLARRVRLA
ncbi:MAG: phosphatase PAP2 family protein [Thermomicrobiales bacterium]